MLFLSISGEWEKFFIEKSENSKSGESNVGTDQAILEMIPALV